MKRQRTMYRSFVVMFMAVVLMASVGFAQQGGNPDIVGDWDADGDGKVTKAEWQRSHALFTKHDTNGNGTIDMDERPQMPTAELMDADEDGKVSVSEFIGPADFFKQLDTNGDGYLTEDENGEK